MNKPLKLIILLLLNISVYFIYLQTKNTIYRLLTITNNSNYTLYIKEYKLKDNKQVNLIDTYSKKDLMLSTLSKEIKTNNNLKQDLSSCNLLILNIGYNDLIYKLSIEENLSVNNFPLIMNSIKEEYISLLKEIRTYYKKKIIVVGYYKPQSNNYYLNKGIIYLNKILNDKSVIYVDTYSIINRNIYFKDINTYKLNSKGNRIVANKIIETLEKYKNI